MVPKRGKEACRYYFSRCSDDKRQQKWCQKEKRRRVGTTFRGEVKTKDFKSGTKMTKSTSVVPKAEQWGRVYDRGKKHFKGFCIPEEISRIKESGQRTVYK